MKFYIPGKPVNDFSFALRKDYNKGSILASLYQNKTIKLFKSHHEAKISQELNYPKLNNLALPIFTVDLSDDFNLGNPLVLRASYNKDNNREAITKDISYYKIESKKIKLSNIDRCEFYTSPWTSSGISTLEFKKSINKSYLTALLSTLNNAIEKLEKECSLNKLEGFHEIVRECTKLYNSLSKDVAACKQNSIDNVFYAFMVDKSVQLVNDLGQCSSKESLLDIVNAFSHQLDIKLESDKRNIPNKNLRTVICGVIGAVVGFAIGVAIGAAATSWGGGFGALPGALIGSFKGFTFGTAIGVALGGGVGLSASTFTLFNTMKKQAKCNADIASLESYNAKLKPIKDAAEKIDSTRSEVKNQPLGSYDTLVKNSKELLEAYQVNPNSLEYIRSLLRRPKIDLLQTDSYGNNALYYAICSGDLESVKPLLEKFPDAINSEFNHRADKAKPMPSQLLHLTPLELAERLNKNKSKDKKIKLNYEPIINYLVELANSIKSQQTHRR